MKQRIIIGSVVRIDLGDQLCSFAQVISKAELAFFNCFDKTPTTLTIEEVVKMPTLFILLVMNYAVKSGRWPVIGKSEVRPEFKTGQYYFHQDIITKKISIGQRGDDLQPATRAQIEGLERLAVWDAVHVEDRLRDAKEKRNNIWVDSLKPV
jgi:Immunity protein 26